MPQQTVFALVTFLHDLFTVTWIGGLVVLGITVLPVAGKLYGRGPETMRLMDAIQARHRWLVYVSIVGLAITGALLARRSPTSAGFLTFATPYATVLSVKHLLTAGMVIVALVRSVVLAPREGPATPAVQKGKVALLYLNLVLGVLVLAATGLLSAYGGRPPGA